MNEIGGYFGLEKLVSNEYHKGLIRLNTATNAVVYLLQAKGIRKVYMPYYLCYAVSHKLVTNGYEVEYYSIHPDFSPMISHVMDEDEIIYIVNYFGQLTNEKISSLKEKYKQIIVDNTHAFFQKPLYGVDTIYSCRKFFGVSDGAYVSTTNPLHEELALDVSKDRMAHVLGRFEGQAAHFYANFQEVDQMLHSEPLKWMSRLTTNLLGAIDYDNVRQIRNTNYAFLEHEFKEKNRLQLVTSDGAFAYPLYIENGIEIRKNLAKKKLYIPTLWPNVLENTVEESIEYRYAANILALPCDQRYGIKEMEYISNLINEVIS
ncbi:hypothetical protein AAGS61_01470 [Lysinibacillus sp. KU-BSD001]|uniref:hypothetical protein n=1 Tax=Lysinibacillus sp. KU-BSD001 TaxID=3141328 RepID=UPI0036E34B55